MYVRMCAKADSHTSVSADVAGLIGLCSMPLLVYRPPSYAKSPTCSARRMTSWRCQCQPTPIIR